MMTVMAVVVAVMSIAMVMARVRPGVARVRSVVDDGGVVVAVGRNGAGGV